MSEKQVAEEDLAKALEALQGIAKGHSSRGTNTTAVESMSDGSASSGSGGGSQVNHTGNSDRDSWAGSSWDGVADNGPGADSVKGDGTDYAAQGKVMKSIMEKIEKGQALSEAELYVFKSVMAKAKKKDDDDDDKDDVAKGKKPAFLEDKDDDDDDDKDDDMGKSLSDFATESESVSKGLEVSEFLAGFAEVMHKSLEQMERRILTRVQGAILSEAEATGEFQKSLANSIVKLGGAVTAVAQRQEQVETQPARGPRAQHRGVDVVKGGYDGSDGGSEPLNKAIIGEVLVDLVQKGQCSPGDVIKYDSLGALSAPLEAKVRAAISGR